MNYRDYKKQMRESILKTSIQSAKKVDLLSEDINLIREGKCSFADLKTFNTRYSLGLDVISAMTVLDALEESLRVAEFEKSASSIDLASIDSDFKTSVVNIPLFIISLLATSTYENVFYIEKIFKKLILSKKNNDWKSINYEDDDSSKLSEYEDRLKDLLEKNKTEEFCNLALEYFDSFLEKEATQDFMKSEDVPLTSLRAWIRGMLQFSTLEKIAIPKEFCVNLKSTLRSFHNKVRASLKPLTDVTNEVIDMDLVQDITRLYVIDKLQKKFKLDNFLNAKSDKLEIVAVLKSLLDKTVLESRKLVSLEQAITEEGFNRPIPGLPRMIVSYQYGTQDDIYFAYFIMTGLKYNGSMRRVIKDEEERMLSAFEVRLASFIQNDFTVKPEDKERFLAIYQLYLASYLRDKELSFNKDDILSNAIENMSMYLDQVRNLTASQKKEPKTPRVIKFVNEEKTEIQENPFDLYLMNYQTTQVGSLEEFEQLLESSTLSEFQKNSYLERMMQLQDQLLEDEIHSKKMEVWNTYFTMDDRKLYLKACKSIDVEVQSIVTELNAIIDLLVDTEDNEEKNELFDTADTYFEVLKDKLHVNGTIVISDDVQNDHQGYQVIYYKDEKDTPYFYHSVLKEQKGNYKMILSSVKKILAGNIINDTFISRDDLPVKIFYKGKNFKTFYTVVGSYIIILDGGSTDRIFDKIAYLVKSREFLSFLKDHQIPFKEGSIPSDEDFTKSILDELASSKGRK